jgi:hypothetical protein
MRDFVTPVDFLYGIFCYIVNFVVDFIINFVPQILADHIDQFFAELFDEGASNVEIAFVELVQGDAINGGGAVGTIEDNRDLSRN